MLPQENRIQTKARLKEYLAAELPFYRCGILQRIFAASEKAILRKHQLLLRKTEYHTNTRHRILALWYRLRLNRMQNRYALHIPLNCCEKGLHIMHIGPILINSEAQLGQRCSLHINTAIVAGGITGDAPRLGDGVVMGVGAVALGGITIADHTAIGANAVVNKDVTEENIAVAGVPAKKVSSNGRQAWNRQTKTNTENE